MRQLSATVRKALYAQETDQVFLTLLEIRHSSLATPIRLVRNTTTITSNGNQFDPYPFTGTVIPGDRDAGIVPQVALVIDNTDRRLVEIIRGVSTPPEVYLSVIAASAPNVPEIGPIRYRVGSVEYNAEAIQATLHIDDGVDDIIPPLSFTPMEFPGVFS